MAHDDHSDEYNEQMNNDELSEDLLGDAGYGDGFDVLDDSADEEAGGFFDPDDDDHD